MAVKLPAVPETILKRRKFQAENCHLRAKEAVTMKSKEAVKFKVVFKIKKGLVNVFNLSLCRLL